MPRKKTITLALTFGVIISGLYAFRFLSGTHTEYCPLSHKLSDTSDCIVLQISHGRVLIRHRDSFTKEAYFEIIENGRSHKFEIPDYTLNGGRQKISVRLIENEESAVTINGEDSSSAPSRAGTGERNQSRYGIELKHRGGVELAQKLQTASSDLTPGMSIVSESLSI